MKVELKKMYNKLLRKDAFCEMVRFKLNVKDKTINEYLCKDNVPTKHVEFIKKALTLQLKADEKYINDIKVNVENEL